MSEREHMSIFTWDTVSNVAGYVKVDDKLRNYVGVHFCDQVTVATRVMYELHILVCTKID